MNTGKWAFAMSIVVMILVSILYALYGKNEVKKILPKRKESIFVGE